MASWLYRSAPRDGTAIAIASQVLPIEQALGAPSVQYDARRLSWIGRAAPVVEVSYTWHTSKTRTLEDARQRETVMGGINPTSNTVTYLRLLNSLAGTRFKIINGYPGTTEMHIAMERGETEGATKTWEAFKADNSDWLRDKKVNMLVQYALMASPELPGVPLMSDLGRSEDDRQVLRFYMSSNELGRSIVTAPEVPPERLAALRTALDDHAQGSGIPRRGKEAQGRDRCDAGAGRAKADRWHPERVAGFDRRRPKGAGVAIRRGRWHAPRRIDRSRRSPRAGTAADRASGFRPRH